MRGCGSLFEKSSAKTFMKSFSQSLHSKRRKFGFLKYSFSLSNEESRRTLRTDDFLFIYNYNIITDSRGRLSLQVFK